MSIKERIAQLQRQQVEQQKSPTKEVQVNRLGEDRLMLKSNATNNHQGIQTDPNALDEERLRLLRMEYESYLREVGKLDITLSFEEWQTKQHEVGRLELQHTRSEADNAPTKRHRRELSAFVGSEDQNLSHSTVTIAGAQAPSITMPTHGDKHNNNLSSTSTSPSSSASSSTKADVYVVPRVSIAERVRRLSAHALTPTSTSPSSSSASVSAVMAEDGDTTNASTVAPVRADADVIVGPAGMSSVAARAALFAQQGHSNGNITQNATNSAKITVGESNDSQRVEGEPQPDVKTKAKLVSSRLSVGNTFFTPVKTENNDSSSTMSITPQKLQFSEGVDNSEQETPQKPKPGRLSVDRLAVLAGGNSMYSPGNNRRESGISALPGQMPFPGSPNQGLTVKQIRAMRMSLGGNPSGNVSSENEKISYEHNSDAVETKVVADEAGVAATQTGAVSAESVIASGDAGVVVAEAGVVSPTLRKPRMRVDRRVSTRVSFSSLEDASAHVYDHTETPLDSQTYPRACAGTNGEDSRADTETQTLTPVPVDVPGEAIQATTVTGGDGDGDGAAATIRDVGVETTAEVEAEVEVETDVEAEAEVEVEAEVEADAGLVDVDVSREACVAANADEEVEAGEHRGFLSSLSLHASTHTTTYTTHTTTSSDSLSSFSPSLRSSNFPFGSPLPTPTPLPLFHTHTVPPPITSEAIPLVIPSLSPCHDERELEWVEEGEERGEEEENADVEDVGSAVVAEGEGEVKGEREGEGEQVWITPIDVNIHADTETEVEVEVETEAEVEARRLAKERELLRLAEKSVREWSSVRVNRGEDSEGKGVVSRRQRQTPTPMQTPAQDKRDDENAGVGNRDGSGVGNAGVGDGSDASVVGNVKENMLQSLLMDEDNSYIYDDNGLQEPLSTVNLNSTENYSLSASLLDFSTTPSSTTPSSTQYPHKDVKFARVTGASAFHTETPTSLSQHTDPKRRGPALAHTHKTIQSELQPSSLAQASMASAQTLPHESAMPFDADIDRDHADFARVVNARLILDSVPQVNKATLRAAAAMHQRVSQTPQKDAIQVRILATRSVADKPGNDTSINITTPEVLSMAPKVDVAPVPSDEEHVVASFAPVLGVEQKAVTNVSDASHEGSWMDKVRSWWPWVLAAGAAVVATRVYITRNNVHK